MKANEIVEILNIFEKSTYYQKILINGPWGIGKTKYLLDFKESNSDVCYVTLFGKRDIESIMQEIYSYILRNERIKRGVKKIQKTLNELTVGTAGVSISIPLIGDLNSSLNKELKKSGNLIIIFDDLERKHPDLNIKEIFGLIDGLSNLENIKTVLVAAGNKIQDDKLTFIDYQEKAVDRTYNITRFADNAPSEIFGENIWRVLEENVKSFEFKNLRTFEKIISFIQEIMGKLDEDFFTERFSKADLYRMCFATVVFKVEHKSEMKLLKTDDPKDEYRNVYYTSDESGVVSYINNYILKNSLDNMMSKNVLSYILEWYETGAFPEEIKDVINSINSFKEEPRNFYSSEQEILEFIKWSESYVNQLTGDENLEATLQRISTALTWSRILEVDFDISNEEILKKIQRNITKKIDIDKNFYHNEIGSFRIQIESERGNQLISAVHDLIKVEYQKLLVRKIESLFSNRVYEVTYLRNLYDLILTNPETEMQNDLFETLERNQFFFPLPLEKITEKQWYWCHQINKIIKDIERVWNKENYYQEFKDNITVLSEEKDSKLLKHRLSTLFGK